VGVKAIEAILMMMMENAKIMITDIIPAMD
jgi:hypothetical protein